MKKNVIILLLALCITGICFAGTINDTQVLKTGHWVYDALYTLGMEQRITGFYENSMLSVGEIKFYLKEIDYDKLSPAGQNLYDRVYSFLYEKENLVKDKAFRFGLGVQANPELYYKTNPDIDWSFRYYFKDNLLTAPVKLGFSDYIAIETDIFLGKSSLGASKSDSFCNVPYRDDDPEFCFPRFAYGSTGFYFDDWGVNFTILKEGLAIGHTQLGSIIYNNTFETDQVMQLNLFTRPFKYSMDVIQKDYRTYMYLHQIEARPFKQFKIGVIEGVQITRPFELRFINPLMVMHSFGAMNDYDDENSVYGEEHICAYLAFLFDWTPAKFLRIYGLFSQNEIQTPTERSQSRMGDLYPDSIGFQLGTEVNIPSKDNGYWHGQLEAVYTSPYLYVKHTPESSLYKAREDNLSSDWICSWIGSPYGPDAFGVQAGFGYEKTAKWKVGFAYLFKLKGENDFSMFEQVRPNVDTNGDGSSDDNDGPAFDYYPPVAWSIDNRLNGNNEDLTHYDEYLADAHNLWMHGTVEQTHQLVLNGEYTVSPKLTLAAQTVYSLILNNEHISDNMEQGLELSFSVKYNLF